MDGSLPASDCLLADVDGLVFFDVLSKYFFWWLLLLMFEYLDVREESNGYSKSVLWHLIVGLKISECESYFVLNDETVLVAGFGVLVSTNLEPLAVRS